MLHSPLTTKENRIESYKSLLDLCDKGSARAVGVCHFGVHHLEELVAEGLPPPAVIQLMLSPFNQHKDVVEWAQSRGSALSCSAWSKLSSKEGPEEGWSAVADLSKNRGMTKAQVLVRWAVQKGYMCVPRSGSKFKIERAAIVENSWEGTRRFVLTEEEMSILDGLDEQLPAGRLGVVDGWDAVDIKSSTWDPTDS